MISRLLINLCVILLGTAASFHVSGSNEDYRPLTDIAFPSEWQLIDDLQAFNSERYAHIEATDDTYKVFDKTCYDELNSWQSYADNSSVYALTQLHYCHNKLTIYGYAGYLPSSTFVPPEIQELFLHWATTNTLIPSLHKLNKGSDRYSSLTNAALGSFAAYYALFKENFNYTDTERNLVEGTLVKNMLYLQSGYLVEYGKSGCDPNSLATTVVNLSNGSMSSNACGSAHWSLVQGMMLLGLSLGNEDLYNGSLEAIDWLLHFFSDDGIFIPFAVGTGGYALDYIVTLPQYLGVLTEIFATLDYDFLKHKTPSGVTIKTVLDSTVDIIKNPKTLPIYEGVLGDLGPLWQPSVLRQRTPQNKHRFVIIKRNTHDYRTWVLKEALRKVAFSWTEFARQSSRYVDRYRPDLAKYRKDDFIGHGENGQRIDMISSYSVVDPYMLYEANALSAAGGASGVKKKRSAAYQYVPKTQTDVDDTPRTTQDVLDALAIKITGSSALDAQSGVGFASSANDKNNYYIDWYLIKAGSSSPEAKLVGTDEIQLEANVATLGLSDDRFYPTRESRENLYIWYLEDHIAMDGYLDIGHYGLFNSSSLVGSLKSGFGFGYVGIYQDIIAFHIR